MFLFVYQKVCFLRGFIHLRAYKMCNDCYLRTPSIFHRMDIQIHRMLGPAGCSNWYSHLHLFQFDPTQHRQRPNNSFHLELCGHSCIAHIYMSIFPYSTLPQRFFPEDHFLQLIGMYAVCRCDFYFLINLSGALFYKCIFAF